MEEFIVQFLFFVRKGLIVPLAIVCRYVSATESTLGVVTVDI